MTIRLHLDPTPAAAPVRVPPPVFDAKFPAPFATLGIRTHDAHLVELCYLPCTVGAAAATTRLAERVVRELERYLADPGYRFTVPLAPHGTAFQRRVWSHLSTIPVSESRTYGEVARTLATAARAIGGACGANPIALIIPCHRVVGTHGKLGGFMQSGAGDPIAIKRWLLVHEGYRFGQ